MSRSVKRGHSFSLAARPVIRGLRGRDWIGAAIVVLGSFRPIIVQIFRKQFSSQSQCFLNVMLPNHLVKVHCNLLIIKSGVHDLIPVLQQARNADKNQEGIAVTKLSRFWKSVTNQGDIVVACKKTITR